MLCLLLFFFFFQAEDGIRDLTVTGVQTCALPISPAITARVLWADVSGHGARAENARLETGATDARSEKDARLKARDRKSTRLNSSHSQISYAVFCLKKKKRKNMRTVFT